MLNSHFKKSFIAIFAIVLICLLSACTPYNGSIYSSSTISNSNFAGQTFNKEVTNSNFKPPNYPPQIHPPRPGAPAPPPPPAPPPHNRPIEPGIQALFNCTSNLGYDVNFNANDYQNCLQLTQATLTNYAFDLLKGYIMTWADYAIDAALSALGFTSGRSLTSTHAKSSQLTSIISTGYRWY